MFKVFSLAIAAAVLSLGASRLHAQQQEATLQKVEIPGIGFDLVVAIAKPSGAQANFRGMPDPLVVYAANGKLVFAIDDKAEAMLKDINVLNAPACTFQTASKGGRSSTPVSVYVIPKYETHASVGMASLDRPGPIMRKVEVPGSALDVVFATVDAPVTLKPGETPDSIAVYSVGSELAMATDGDVARMFKDVGYSELPACGFEVEHKGSNPPQAASIYVFSKNRMVEY